MQKVPGGPNPAAAALMNAGAQAGAVGTSNRYHWQVARDEPGAKTDFPIVPVNKDAYDDVANIKDQFAYQGGVGSNWVVPFTESDAAYLMRKRGAEEAAQFDMWISQKYDLTDPGQNMMLQQIAPDLFQRREEVIDSQQDLVSRYAKLRLRGAKSKEDLYFEWLVETGRMELPKGPIWDPLAWRRGQTSTADAQADRRWNRNRYYAGFFSPLKWMSHTQIGDKSNPDNMFDITGIEGDKYVNNVAGGPYGGSEDSYAHRYANVYKPAPIPAVAGGRVANVPNNHP